MGGTLNLENRDPEVGPNIFPKIFFSKFSQNFFFKIFPKFVFQNFAKFFFFKILPNFFFQNFPKTFFSKFSQNFFLKFCQFFFSKFLHQKVVNFCTLEVISQDHLFSISKVTPFFVSTNQEESPTTSSFGIRTFSKISSSYRRGFFGFS